MTTLLLRRPEILLSASLYEKLILLPRPSSPLVQEETQGSFTSKVFMRLQFFQGADRRDPRLSDLRSPWTHNNINKDNDNNNTRRCPAKATSIVIVLFRSVVRQGY